MIAVLRSTKTNLSRYIDVAYFLRFFTMLMIFYSFNFCFTGLVDNRGMIYSSFLDNNINYISWIRNTLLYTSNNIAHAIGVNSHIDFPDHLRTANRAWVEVAYGCVGMNLMGFWTVFVLANKESLKRSIFWCTAGIIGIWFINCWRIALLIFAFDRRWNVNDILNHHTQYNLVIYSFIVLMIFLYIKAVKSREAAVKQVI